jgi:hypothetical protein
MEKIIDGLISTGINIFSTAILLSIGYLYWRVIKPAVRIDNSISETTMPEYDTVDGAVKSSIEHNANGIYYLFKIANISKIFEAKDFEIRLLAGKLEKDKENKTGTRYGEVEIVYGALTKLEISSSANNSHYLIATTKPLRKILRKYDNLKLIVKYKNTINKEFTIEQTFTENNIIYGYVSYGDDLYGETYKN